MRESEIQGDSEQLINTASLFLFLTNNPLPPQSGFAHVSVYCSH